MSDSLDYSKLTDCELWKLFYGSRSILGFFYFHFGKLGIDLEKTEERPEGFDSVRKIFDSTADILNHRGLLADL